MPAVTALATSPTAGSSAASSRHQRSVATLRTSEVTGGIRSVGSGVIAGFRRAWAGAGVVRTCSGPGAAPAVW
ncbi:Uncharacterised protein [Mycobacteroides abscessus subsp. abscessus]|nr:Uncharacterised protein [Mycobacteroides abscessus subsp. abscessus]